MNALCGIGESETLNLLQPRLSDSDTAVVIPLDHCIVFVRSLNRTDLPRRLSKVAQTLDPVPGIYFLIRGGRRDERWSFGTVCIGRCTRA